MQSACGKEKTRLLWRRLLPFSLALSIALPIAATGCLFAPACAGPAETLASIIPGAKPAAIPAESDSALGFAPQGWTVFASAEGDFNRDGRSDAAMIICKEGDTPGSFGDGAKDMPRAVVVATAQPNGKYKLAGIGYGPVMSGATQVNFAQTVVEISLVKGRLIIKNGNSASFIQAHELTFSWQHGQMELTNVSLNHCTLREPTPHSSDEERDLNTGAVSRVVSDNDGKVISASYFYALRAPLVKTMPVLDGDATIGEWPSQIVHLNKRANIVRGAGAVPRTAGLSVDLQAVRSAEDLYICASTRGNLPADPDGKVRYSLRLMGVDGKMFMPQQSKTTIKNGIATVEGKFKLSQIPKNMIDENDYAPVRLNLATQLVVDLRAANDPALKNPAVIKQIVFSTGNGQKHLGEISLVARAHQPTLEDWTWEHPDD